MAAKLTKQKLIENISQAHCSIKLGLSEDPDKDKERIYAWVKRLIKEHCKFKLEAANNEGKPWNEKETGLKIEPMKTKALTGRKQVLDYHPYIYFDEWIPLSFGIERKSKEDWHGTLFVGSNYRRFKREIQTCKDDPIINDPYVFVEAPYEDWLVYYPPVCRYSTRDIAKMIFSKEHALAAVMSKGVSVNFFSSRKKAAGFVKILAFHHAVEHYAEWMNL